MDILSSIEPVFSNLCVLYIKSYVAKLFDVSLSLFVCWKSCARKVQARQFVLQDELRSGYFNVQITICFRQSIYQLLLSKSDGLNLIEELFFYNQFQCFSIHAFGWLEVWQSVWKLQVIIFSCPGQLNRWPCHSLSGWVIDWLLISASSEHCRAVVDTCNLSDNWSEGF